MKKMNQKMMKAVLGKDYGNTDKMISVVAKFPVPTFDTKTNDFCLLKIQACALAPGDVRVMSGKTKEFQGPKKFPFIPGGDVCGIVEKISDSETRLKVGDNVVAMFHERPKDGLAEYGVVSTKMAVIKPKNLSPEKGAALGSSGTSAMVISQYVRKGDRVLVLGGSGGVGTILVQLAKLKGASFVAATSTDEKLLKSLGVDQVIDYRKVDVWKMKEFMKKKFDIIVDLVEGGWEHAYRGEILKSGYEGGYFLTTVPDKAIFEIHSIWQMGQVFIFPILGHTLWSMVKTSGPKYRFVMGLTSDRQVMVDLFKLVEKGDVKVVLDGGKSYEFTTKDVRAAYRKQASRHAHGKVVVKISN